MFVTVRYGDDRSKIFNSYCKNEILLANIKTQCGCGQEEIVEVSDESGVVKNLRNYPSDYGSEFLKEREVLVLLTVNHTSFERREDGEGDSTRPLFTPTLSSLRNDRQFNESINQEPPAPDSPPGSVQGLGSGTNRQQQQQQTSPPAEGENDAEGKAFKTKVKVLNHINSSIGGGSSKKALLRKSTKALLKK